MLFHAGCLWRLNELGWLPRIRHVSTVSAGAITAGALAVNWKTLRFDATGVAENFEEQIVAPVRALARQTIDSWCMLGDACSPLSAAEIMADALDLYVFTGRTLRQLPEETNGVPRFTFTASNLQTSALFSFSQSRVWDWRLGDIEGPAIRLAIAVAAASALVPMFSALELPCRAPASADADSVAVLTDGAVIDPLALAPVWGRSGSVLVCDGGPSVPDSVPKADCYLRTADTLRVMHEQTRRAQRTQVLDALGKADGVRGGYCRLDSVETDDMDVSSAAAETASARYLAMDDSRQEELINTGYSACDDAVRRWGPATALTQTRQLPYATAAAGSPRLRPVAGAA